MKNKLNIVLYVNSFLPSLGGREFVVHYLADALTKLGHKVRVVGPAGFWKQRKVKFHYPVHRWPTLRGLMPEQVALTSLSLDILLWDCDVIHAHNTYPTGYIAALFGKKSNYPLVITPHGEDIQTIPEIGYGLMLDPDLNQKIKHALVKADLITAISKQIEKVTINAGVPAEKIRWVPNGVDTGRFSGKETTDVKAWLGLTQESRLIVTIGRYNPRKGHEYLIRAMPRVLEADEKACLVIVGENTGILEPLIEELNLDGKVILTGGISPSSSILNRAVLRDEGHLEPDYLAELLSAAELYASAGTDDNAEGLSLAVLEAMAAGLPVVATDISGNRDVVTPGENGYLVKAADSDSLADGMIKLLTDGNVQNKMRVHARNASMRYDWIKIAQSYVEVYREAIAIKQACVSPVQE